MWVFNVRASTDNDGKAEVIFATKTGLRGVPVGCTQNTCQWGSLFILDHQVRTRLSVVLFSFFTLFQANVLAKVPLPMPKSCQARS